MQENSNPQTGKKGKKKKQNENPQRCSRNPATEMKMKGENKDM